MQLNNQHKNIRHLLKAATGCLLGASSIAQANVKEDYFSGWETDIAVLAYSEADRVSALEPVINTKKTFLDDSVLGLKLTFDSLTGASPNGASPSDQAQTFTRPSGKGSYEIGSGETPLDDTFHDTRVSVGGSYQHDLNRIDKMIWGANISKEFDFFSSAVSATYLHDFNNRNNTLSLGVSGEYDLITPVGGLPIALSQMQSSNSTQTKGDDSDTRLMSEVLIGLTQIINRQTIMQFNYGFSHSTGYHNDPYKITSVVDDVTGDLVAGDSLDGTYLYDSRPGSRTKHSLYSKVKHAFGEDSGAIAYRYMWDDWGVQSHTFDLSYRANFTSWYLEPSLRYYMQSAADFYRHSISESEVADIGDYLSSDYRLAEMWSTTLGIKVGFKSESGNEQSVRLQYYHQDGDTRPSDAIGIQKNYDMYPTLDAFVVQYTYSF